MKPSFPKQKHLQKLFPVAFKIKIGIIILVWHWSQRDLDSNTGFPTDWVTLASYFACLILKEASDSLSIKCIVKVLTSKSCLRLNEIILTKCLKQRLTS